MLSSSLDRAFDWLWENVGVLFTFHPNPWPYFQVPLARRGLVLYGFAINLPFLTVTFCSRGPKWDLFHCIYTAFRALEKS